MNEGRSGGRSDGTLPRRVIHRACEEVRPHVAGAESGETLEGLKERVRVGNDLKEVIEAFSSIDKSPFASTQFLQEVYSKHRAGAAKVGFPSFVSAFEVTGTRVLQLQRTSGRSRINDGWGLS